MIVVPSRKSPAQCFPLILSLHGAGANGHDAIQPFRLEAERQGFVVAAPDSRAERWDGMKDGWGPDVDFIDLVLHRVFERCHIDRRRIAIAGFSDGASYALSLGLANGDLFTHVIAFSAGFMRAPSRQGQPKVFVSHGTQDVVLPSSRCSQRIVTRLQKEGYNVHFEEFDGGHLVPPAVARKAIRWLLS